MKEIKSTVIGKLYQNEEFADWWESELIQIPFFGNTELKVTFLDFVPEDDQAYLLEADNAMKNFLLKNSDERFELSALVRQNCREFLEAIGYDEVDKPLWEIEHKDEIWTFVYPQEITLTRRHRRDEDIYLSIMCDCEWEQEHGLQLVFRQGKQLTRISAQDGWVTEADAYDKPDEKDELLHKFSA